MRAPSPEAEAFVREHVDVTRWRDVTLPDGEADAWAVETPSGVAAYLKVHHAAGKARRERDAHRALGPRLHDWLPELLAVSDDPVPMLLLRAVPGELASRARLSPDARRRLHEQAGRFRRALDAVPVPPDPVPLDEAIARRVESWWRRAEGLVDRRSLTALRRGCRPEAFAGLERRWSHRDFHERNWIVTGAGNLRVIDLGHARPDAWMVDLVKLWDAAWLEEPTLEAAFFRGLGRAMSDAERSAFDTLCRLHAVATITWSREHDAPSYEAHGRRVLDRLLC